MRVNNQKEMSSTYMFSLPYPGVDLVKPATIYVNFPSFDDPPTSPTKTDSTASTPLKTQKSFPESVDSTTLKQIESLEEKTQQFDERLAKVETRTQSENLSLNKLQNLMKLEADVTKVSRDIVSARADSKRAEGRLGKVSEEVCAVKEEITRIGKTLYCSWRMCLPTVVLIAFLSHSNNKTVADPAGGLGCSSTPLSFQIPKLIIYCYC